MPTVSTNDDEKSAVKRTLVSTEKKKGSDKDAFCPQPTNKNNPSSSSSNIRYTNDKSQKDKCPLLESEGGESEMK